MCSPHQNAFRSFCQKSLKHTLFHKKREFLWFKIIRMVFPGSLFTVAEFLTMFQIMPFISLTPRAEDRERQLNSFPVQWSSWAAQLGNCGQVTVLFICVREAKTKPGWTGERTHYQNLVRNLPLHSVPIKASLTAEQQLGSKMKKTGRYQET